MEGWGLRSLLLFRCGRPNLNHVTECYKCGATLPPAASSKWVYVGSHSGRGTPSLPPHLSLCDHCILDPQLTRPAQSPQWKPWKPEVCITYLLPFNFLFLTTPPFDDLSIPDHSPFHSRPLPPVLLSRAPVSCIRCNNIRASGYLKCGRCGDVYKTRPLVDPLGHRLDYAPPSKKRRTSADDRKANKQTEKQVIGE